MPGKTAKTVQAKSESVDSPKSSQKKTPKNSATVKLPAKAVGYLRVSTGDQELEKNKADILRLANDLDLGKVRFVEEKISGKISWRKRKVAGILHQPAKGECIFGRELSRVGKNYVEIFEILFVGFTKGVSVYSVK